MSNVSWIRAALGTLLFLAPCLAPPAGAAPAQPEVHEVVEVTATRMPEDPIEIPASIRVVSGEDLERLQIRNLPQALSLVMGVSVAPGGDGGPAISVPEMMGLREFDAFLLVVDDVPWGGAFNPALATLDLTNVDRIEVLRGSAPVMYGATSFVGVIHVIHRQPDAMPTEFRASGGNFGSFGAGGFAPLPSAGAWRHSLSASYDETGFKDDRTHVDRAHLLYRGAAEVAGGKLRVDFDATRVGQDPASPHPRAGTSLTPLVPLDANHNPSDARQDEDRYHLVFGFVTPALGGAWTTTLALTHSERKLIKGFLRADFQVPPPTANADGFRQTIDQDDVYFDSHLAKRAGDKLSFVFGVDELFGQGAMDAENFEYHVNPDGSGAPSSAGIPIDERPSLDDRRSFAGVYGQLTWAPVPRLRVQAGARLNVTRERQAGAVESGGSAQPVRDSRSETRGSGSVGASWRAWQRNADSLWLFAGYRNTFKPAALDFGPEAQGAILEPEDAEMLEGGVKGTNLSGRLGWELSGYHMTFNNVVVATQVNGLPALENAGEEIFDGIEGEASWAFGPSLRAQASYAYHNAEFGDYLADFGGSLRQLEGNRIEMSAKHLAGAGVSYLPDKGFNANATLQYVGERYLNKRNTAPADAYMTWSLGAGYRFAHAEVRVDGVNLNDARDPVAESELGDAQYYRLSARTVMGTIVWRM